MTGTSDLSSRSLGWRRPILGHFTPEIAGASRLTIVADPDELLTEQDILSALLVRGFDLVPFEDHVAFRFAYESRYRQLWDRGEKTNLVVVLRSPSADVDELPYDLIEQARHQGRCLKFSVGDLFPNLSPSVVISLDRSHFNKLYEAQSRSEPLRLGVDATRDFVLFHVFEIAPELIKSPSDLLRVLLRRHYRGVDFPTDLDERFINLLARDARWSDWPLADIVPSRAAFLAFLDERWPHFVKQVSKPRGDVVSEPSVSYGLSYSGPVDLPFGHDDVKVYIDNLFQEGALTPTEGVRVADLPSEWMKIGVVTPDDDEKGERFRRLFGRLRDELPDDNAEHRDWVRFTQTWAEWVALRWRLSDTDAGVSDDECETLHDDVEGVFAGWMQRHFASLHNLSPSLRPAMVHHIPHHMAHKFTATGAAAAGSGPPKKHALIVIDGLAWDQWVTLREVLSGQLSEAALIEEDGAFAWVPTLTGVSRQAIFAGAEPIFFAHSLGSTAKEPALWTKFWEDRGAKRVEIGYVREGKDQSDDDFLLEVLKVSEHPKMRLLGVVVGKVDQSMHGIKTGTSGLHAVIRDWAESGAIAKLLQKLLEDRYEILITADHGNIQGHGIGKPKVGAIADERGERVHVFPDERLRAGVATDFAGTIEWPQIGLPANYRALLAPGRGAFIAEGKQVVGHGGIALEEVIVPFIMIRGGER